MVTFELTAGGYTVKVNHQHVGWISRERGFFTDPTAIKEFIEISPADLKTIAEKAKSEQTLTTSNHAFLVE